MATKHIDEETWRKVEKKTMEAIIELKRPVKDTKVLKLLILKGIKEIKAEDWKDLGKM